MQELTESHHIWECITHQWFINITNIKDYCTLIPQEIDIMHITEMILIKDLSCCCEVFLLNTLRPRQNGRHFADNTFKHIFLNENVIISIKISLKFVPKGPINNIPPLVQIMAWRRPGKKPLSEPMMVRLPMHICVTRPQWVNFMWQGWVIIRSYE